MFGLCKFIPNVSTPTWAKAPKCGKHLDLSEKRWWRMTTIAKRVTVDCKPYRHWRIGSIVVLLTKPMITVVSIMTVKILCTSLICYFPDNFFSSKSPYIGASRWAQQSKVDRVKRYGYLFPGVMIHFYGIAFILVDGIHRAQEIQMMGILFLIQPTSLMLMIFSLQMQTKNRQDFALGFQYH